MNEHFQMINQRLEARVDLERCGFTAEQSGRLVNLRERYHPLIEQVETHQQWEQLQFLRWLYRRGICPPG